MALKTQETGKEELNTSGEKLMYADGKKAKLNAVLATQTKS